MRTVNGANAQQLEEHIPNWNGWCRLEVVTKTLRGGVAKYAELKRNVSSPFIPSL